MAAQTGSAVPCTSTRTIAAQSAARAPGRWISYTFI